MLCHKLMRLIPPLRPSLSRTRLLFRRAEELPSDQDTSAPIPEYTMNQVDASQYLDINKIWERVSSREPFIPQSYKLSQNRKLPSPTHSANSFFSCSFLYDSLSQKFINQLLEGGDKTKAQRFFSQALDRIRTKLIQAAHLANPDSPPAADQIDPVRYFHKAVSNVMPLMETVSVGPMNQYAVPIKIRDKRRISMAMKWLVSHSSEIGATNEKIDSKLAKVIELAYNKQGTAYDTKIQMSKLCVSNRSHAAFRYFKRKKKTLKRGSMSGSLLDVKSHIKDLGHLQVFVYPISDVSGELYHRIYNFLRDNSSLLLLPPKGLTSNPGLLGPVRAMFNFERHLAPWSYSVKYNKFMSHKQLSGLVGVAHCSELSQVQAIHETVYSISNCYKGAICHSICLVFCTTEAEIYSPCDYSPTEDPEAGLSFKQSLEEAFSRLNTSGIEYILINISYRARDDSLDDFINYNKLEEVLSCFTLVLNSTLESRRQTQIKLLQTENFESMNKLKSPFEEADLDIKDKKLLMKRYKARVFKHIADLTLQCGRHEEALHYYTTAAEQLRATQDWIWMGAACEGLAATAYIRDMKLKTTTLMSPHSSEAPIPFSGSLFSLRDSVEMLSLDDMERGGQDDFSDTNSIGDKGSFGVEAINTALMPDLTKPIELKRDFIGSKFTESITYYKKAGISGSIPQMEALLKLTRYLIEQNRKLDAHTQLRRIMEIQCSLDGVLKMELLSGIAEIYREIGFYRLAGIYYKWAVTCSGKETTLEYANKAYRMLELALPGYNLEIRNGCVQTPSREKGWPLLQSQIIYLMFNIARRTKKESLTFRYLHLLLNNYSQYMHSEQVKNLFNRYKKRIELIKRENQEHSYKYQLCSIPRVSCFRPSPLLPDLLPKFNLDVKSAADKISSKNDTSTHVFWIQHHNCPTNVTVFNFLPIELNITNMRLITTGPECELSKTGVYLPPFCDSHSFDLPCKPVQEGSLKILVRKLTAQFD